MFGIPVRLRWGGCQLLPFLLQRFTHDQTGMTRQEYLLISLKEYPEQYTICTKEQWDEILSALEKYLPAAFYSDWLDSYEVTELTPNKASILRKLMEV